MRLDRVILGLMMLTTLSAPAWADRDPRMPFKVRQLAVENEGVILQKIFDALADQTGKDISSIHWEKSQCFSNELLADRGGISGTCLVSLDLYTETSLEEISGLFSPEPKASEVADGASAHGAGAEGIHTIEILGSGGAGVSARFVDPIQYSVDLRGDADGQGLVISVASQD